MRAIVGNLATKILIYPLAFASSVVVDRTLGPHEKGLFAFLLLVGNLVLPLLTFGFGAAVIYYISSEKRSATEVGFTSLLVGLVQGSICSVIVYVLWTFDLLGATGRELSSENLWPILAIAPLQGTQLMVGRILFGQSRFGVSNWLEIGRGCLNPLLLLTFVVVGRMGLSGAVLATMVLNVGITVAMLATLIPNKMKFRFDYQFFREGMQYGLKVWVGDLATRANLRLDQLVLGIFAPAASLGNYSVAVAMSEMLWVGIDAVSPVLFNRLAGSQNTEARVALTDRAHRVGLLAMAVLATLAGVTGWWVIPRLFGPEFHQTPLLFELLLPGTVGLFTAKVLTKYFAAAGNPEIVGRLGLLSGLAGATLYFVLIPFGATVGAAIASSASYIVMSALAVLFYRGAIKPHRERLFRIDRTDVAWLSARLRPGRGARPSD